MTRGPLDEIVDETAPPETVSSRTVIDLRGCEYMPSVHENRRAFRIRHRELGDIVVELDIMEPSNPRDLWLMMRKDGRGLLRYAEWEMHQLQIWHVHRSGIDMSVTLYADGGPHRVTVLVDLEVLDS